MTFEEMHAQAAQMGIAPADMRRNCVNQRNCYRKLSRKDGDMWDVAAKGADKMLSWLDTHAI